MNKLTAGNIVHLVASVVALALVPYFTIAQAPFVTCGYDKMCEFADLFTVINRIIEWIIIISASVAAIMFAYAGFLYLTAAGNTGQISKAHGIFKNVAVGFVIILIAWLFIQALLKTLGVDDSLIKRLFSF